MKKAIIGKKLGMTQIFLPDGRLVPVTVIQAGPCTVVTKKSASGKDGYDAVQFSFEELSEKRAEKLLTKPINGHYKKAGVKPARTLRELPAPSTAGTSTPAPWPTAPSIIAASAP